MRVFIHDEFPPETSAMLQALYSRSAQSVEQHAEKVREKGADNFMANYYVGYGHASIGDCGVTTLYIEDVSILACKAIQDNALYSGQETSTRYIDFAHRRVHDPLGTRESADILQRWIAFYIENKDALVTSLKAKFPVEPGASEKVWEKAIAAHAFDILRGFLPAGVTSQVAWTTNLRQAHEQVLRLIAHPASEVRAIAEACLRLLKERYPNSFGHAVSPEESAYYREAYAVETYAAPEAPHLRPGDFLMESTVDNARLEAEALDIVQHRPRKANLPKSLTRFGRYTCRFLLDFGSFRDLQRHRGGFCRMPLIASEPGFHSWYLDQMPPAMRERAVSLVSDQLQRISKLDGALSDAERQYYYPLGMNVACELVYDLPQMVYVAELRSGKTVHPTLRWAAQKMALHLKQLHPRLALYANFASSAFQAHRGTQDIEERAAT
ncbi:MAG TPA: FAD-dependent thymidylate synthase [Rhizomicrobium sp.]|jgi:thymidylate synthase ThyX